MIQLGMPEQGRNGFNGVPLRQGPTGHVGADAANLRANAGTVTSGALWILGTETRHEPHGHGRYRRIFDHG
ncbi:hypothetical protein B7R77_24445 [Ralstonia solanacearum K60]|uniref:Uncharacterized protein n=1 Tax=Ralstonia solanacearum K60 TaxID=1091042 RepID=A0AAP7ZJW8_RALSL|nr:hypothetical protein B7R77_24445 [Ralstonia solanacearum K60]